MSRGTLDHTSSFLVSTTGLLPSMAELSNSLHLRYCIHVVCPQPQRSKLHWFGLFRVRSPLLTESNFFLFLRVLRCFSSPGYPLIGYVFTYGYLSITLSAFPHSEICGLTDICSFPQLIAACHVLLRLLVPRHPPCALCYLTSSKLPSLCSQQSLRISAHARRIISPLK